MPSKNHKEVNGSKRHVANTAGMEQRSKYQNEFTKKKRIGDYPKEPNRQQEICGGTTPLSMGTPSATQDPLIDTESDDDVSFSVVATRKWLLSIMSLITPGCRWTTTGYHIINFLIAQTNKYVTDWGKNILHLPKDFINWSMNSITTKVVIRFKTRPYKVIKTLQFQQPYQNVVLA